MKENKLIAEFMGVDYVDVDTYLEDNKELQYHTSWDWLMPVVIKCFDKHFENSDDLNFKLNDALLETNIESLYKAVLEFIKQWKKIK
jgi:hypothetical protein